MADRLTALIEPTIAGLGYELLGIERGRGGGGQMLRLYIDRGQSNPDGSAEGITVDDCARVSRQVGDVIEVEDAIHGEYTLEVSSPGIERPLFTLEQHRRFVGEQVAVRLRAPLEGRRRLRGPLLDVTDENIVVEADGETFEVPFRVIERSRLAPDWDQDKPSRRGSIRRREDNGTGERS